MDLCRARPRHLDLDWRLHLAAHEIRLNVNPDALDSRGRPTCTGGVKMTPKGSVPTPRCCLLRKIARYLRQESALAPPGGLIHRGTSSLWRGPVARSPIIAVAASVADPGGVVLDRRWLSRAPQIARISAGLWRPHRSANGQFRAKPAQARSSAAAPGPRRALPLSLLPQPRPEDHDRCP